METGRIIVVSAPSGAGKSTLLRIARENLPQLYVTISATTRLPRPGEVDGKDYYFISREQFQDSVAKNAFAEWAEVHGHLYGTYKSEIDRHITAGETILLEVDVQGMRSIKALYPDMVSIFITPPGMDELKNRLIRRGTDEAGDIEIRLANARREMAARDEFDYCVVNDTLDRAAAMFVAIIRETIRRQAFLETKLK